MHELLKPLSYLPWWLLFIPKTVLVAIAQIRVPEKNYLQQFQSPTELVVAHI